MTHRPSRIYTRQGDDGRTALLSGERVSKGDARVAAAGDIDELNSFLGAAAAHLGRGRARAGRELRGAQKAMLQLGALVSLAGSGSRRRAPPRITSRQVAALEAAIDRMERSLPPLREFVLPGGTPAAAWAHVARSVCRRAERRVARLAEALPAGAAHGIPRPALAYLNRLSDYLFVLARWLEHGARSGTSD